MFCAICQHDIANGDCVCPDIEQRLRSLYSCPMAIAAAQNLAMRDLLKKLKEEETPNEV